MVHGSGPILKSCHKLGEATGSTLTARGSMEAALWQARGGGATDIDIVDAVHTLHTTNDI